jgi:hypothetical protein
MHFFSINEPDVYGDNNSIAKGSPVIPVPESGVCAFTMSLTAARIDGTPSAATNVGNGYAATGLLVNNDGTVSLEGGTVTELYATSDLPETKVTLSADTTNKGLQVQVNGLASQEHEWIGHFTCNPVGGAIQG